MMLLDAMPPMPDTSLYRENTPMPDAAAQRPRFVTFRCRCFRRAFQLPKRYFHFDADYATARTITPPDADVFATL